MSDAVVHQVADKFVMIRPLHFGFNTETAVSNSFQKKVKSENVSEKAREEFDAMLQLLLKSEMDVLVINDKPHTVTPDSVFPNNWFACPGNNTLILFPMLSPLRRHERRPEVINLIKESLPVEQIIDYAGFESKQQYLEGTGSMVLDHVNRIAYASVSSRTSEGLFYTFCSAMNYKPILFQAFDDKAQPVYHTNVLLTIGEAFAVLCADAITDSVKQKAIMESLRVTGHELILISQSQMNCFAGNMLQMRNKSGQLYIVCSKTAYNSLELRQIIMLKQHGQLILPDINTIETVGGGSVRCMIAEIFY